LGAGFRDPMFSRFIRQSLGPMVLVTIVAATAADNPTTPAGPTYFFSHLAGPLGGPGNADGTGPEARFTYPAGVAVDGAGVVYVTDQSGALLRRISPAGQVDTLAGSGQGPGSEDTIYPMLGGVAVDASGNVYVVDSGKNTVRKITPAHVVTTLAGTAGIQGSADGIGAAASFDGPSDVAADRAGIVYVVDRYNHTIRKITADGTVTTFAGLSGAVGHVDGVGPAARFAVPCGVATDDAGNVYVADEGDSTIRKITPDGMVTTFAGSANGGQGNADGLAASARFNLPRDVAVDYAGNVFVADTNNNAIRKISPAGEVTTLAGRADPDNIGTSDGTGPAAQFHYPVRVAVDRNGNVYVADGDLSNTIRKITSGGVVTTLAGRAGGMGHVDGTGTAARFKYPQGVAVDAAHFVYVADKNNSTIRKITPAGAVSTLAGMPDTPGNTDGTGAAARFNAPAGLAVDAAGNLFVADQYNHTIRRITPDGAVTTFAGAAGVPGGTDGTGAAARFNEPIGLAFDRAGNLLVADALNSTVRKITPAGVVTTVAGTPAVYGSADGTGAAAQFYCPAAVAVDSKGNIFVADLYNYTVRKITPAGVVTTLAGTAGVVGSTDGTGPAAQFHYPYGLAVDRADNVLLAEGNSTIRHITPDGVVTTLAGTAGVWGSRDGINQEAQFFFPLGIAISATGDLYVADNINGAIRKGQPAASPTITTQPQGMTVSPGNSAQLAVTADGVPAPVFQWQRNGSTISGATNSTFTLTSAQTTDAGDYTVVVTNALGSVTSAKATLAVTAAPVPPPPVSSGGGGGGAPSIWFLLSLGTLRLLHRVGLRPRWRRDRRSL